MNIKSVTIVAIRIIALYLGLFALSSILPILGSFTSFFTGNDIFSEDMFMAAMVTGYGLLYLVGCTILWPLAPKITNAICKGFVHESTPNSDISIANIQIAALSVLGFIILSGAVPSLIRILSAVVFPSLNSKYSAVPYGLDSKMVTIIPWSDIIYLVARLTLGVWFIIGSSGIIHLTHKLRNAGRQTYKD